MKKDSLFPLDGEVGKKEQAKVKRNKVKKSVRVPRVSCKFLISTKTNKKTSRKQL